MSTLAASCLVYICSVVVVSIWLCSFCCLLVVPVSSFFVMPDESCLHLDVCWSDENVLSALLYERRYCLCFDLVAFIYRFLFCDCLFTALFQVMLQLSSPAASSADIRLAKVLSSSFDLPFFCLFHMQYLLILTVCVPSVVSFLPYRSLLLLTVFIACVLLIIVSLLYAQDVCCYFFCHAYSGNRGRTLCFASYKSFGCTVGTWPVWET